MKGNHQTVEEKDFATKLLTLVQELDKSLSHSINPSSESTKARNLPSKKKENFRKSQT